MRSWGLRVFGAIAGLGVVAGGIGPALAQSKPLTPVRYEEVIRSIFYLPSYVALAKGYFKDEGLDVSMKTSWGSDKGVAALLSGTADIVLVGPETSVYIKNQESPEKVKIFAGLTATDGSLLIGRKPAGKFDWKQLKGSTILSWRIGSSPDLYLRHVLRAHGLDPRKDVTLVTNLAATARHGAFAAGKGDYATFYEPDVAEFEKAGQAHFIASVGKAVGQIDETVFEATDGYIKKNPTVVQAWTNAIYKAQRYSATADPKELARLVAPFFPNIDEEAMARSVTRYRELGMYKATPLVTPDAIKGLQDLLVEGGLLKQAERVKYEDVVAPDFARKAMQSVAAK